MRAWLALLLALAAAPAAAQGGGDSGPGESGPLLGLRVGYGGAFGDLARDGEAVRDVVPARVPLWLDLGYRFNARVQGTLFLDLAPARVAAAACGGEGSCEAWDLRAGLAVEVHLAPHALLDPWLGLGVGMEMLRAEVQAPAPAPGRWEWTWAGVELPLAEAGVDVRLSSYVTLGPWVSASLAQFTSVRGKPVGGTGSFTEIAHRALHGWVQAGLKATLWL